MQSKRQFLIPASFKVEPFICKRESFFEQSDELSDVLLKEPFYFDMRTIQDPSLEILPWQEPKVHVAVVFDLWKLLKKRARESFKERDKSNGDILILCLSLFILGLHWSNRRSVKSLQINEMGLNSFLRKPINCEERLQFILIKPTQYHAFVQIEQLFDELEKSYYKAIALKHI